MNEHNDSSRIINLSQSIKKAHEQIEKIDDLIIKITNQRKDLIKSIIDDLTAIQKLSFEEVKESDEGTRRLFDESVSRPINQLITEIIRSLKSSIDPKENSLTSGKVSKQMIETLKKVKGFKAYLSEIQRAQLDQLFYLPDAYRGPI
tara:strand:+ start:396 stop:836 length:441 start_codon:yes stop_codon:yes gene_type:complete